MKRKMISIVLIFALIAGGCSCAFWGVRGNGKLKTENRNISDFSNIEAAGAYLINVKCNQEPSLKITAEENLLPYIRTKVYGKTLRIDTKKNISPRKEIVIEITVNDLKELNCSGANSIKVKDIDTDEFTVSLSGAGNIKLSGVTEKLNARISGAGNLDAKELKAEDVYVSVSGAGNAEVYSSNYLNASVSGIGSIDYYGNPAETKTNVSGIGSIKRR